MLLLAVDVIVVDTTAAAAVAIAVIIVDVVVAGDGGVDTVAAAAAAAAAAACCYRCCFFVLLPSLLLISRPQNSSFYPDPDRDASHTGHPTLYVHLTIFLVQYMKSCSIIVDRYKVRSHTSRTLPLPPPTYRSQSQALSIKLVLK